MEGKEKSTIACWLLDVTAWLDGACRAALIVGVISIFYVVTTYANGGVIMVLNKMEATQGEWKRK